MNCFQLLDLVMQRLGNRTEATLRANALLELTLIQQNILEQAETLPWFLKTENLGLSTPGDSVSRSVALPAGFLREVDEGALYIVDSEGNAHECTKNDYNILVQKHTLEATSDLPLEYAIRGTSLEFFPIPTVARALRFNYYVRAEVPQDTAGSENVWHVNASDLLLGELGTTMAAQYLQNNELATTFAGMAARARRRLHYAEVAREEAARARSAGDD